jgi:hypothetical protein
MAITTSTVALSVTFLIVLVGHVLFRRRPLKDLRGPPSPSFLLGECRSICPPPSLIFFVEGHEYLMRHQEEVIFSL